MTHASDRDRATVGEASVFAVREEHDPEAVRALLSEDPSFAAFALGHLEPELLPHSRFWTAEGPGGRTGIVMHARANLGRTTVLAGDADAVQAVLSLHPGPGGGYLATCAPEHVAVAERVYDLGDPLHMMRMTVDSHAFRDPPAAAMQGVRRLVRADARQLNALYATGDGPTGYRGEHIERGVYFGVFDEGQLRAVAGTHMLAPHIGIAVVGNVFTHASARGRGLAGAVTAAVTRELFARGCATVTLTVDPENTPAVRAYQRLGYVAGAPIVEARIRRRDVFGLGSLLRRLFTRRDDDGAALVRASLRPDDGRAGRSES
ncbi:MAG: GNAT family N-acetyltransferase [Chloroflexi bacterium]|nr:GNAT family N-acetyltransferase [Chloroflexota bacterium]